MAGTRLLVSHAIARCRTPLSPSQRRRPQPRRAPQLKAVVAAVFDSPVLAPLAPQLAPVRAFFEASPVYLVALLVGLAVLPVALLLTRGGKKQVRLGAGRTPTRDAASGLRWSTRVPGAPSQHLLSCAQTALGEASARGMPSPQARCPRPLFHSCRRRSAGRRGPGQEARHHRQGRRRARQVARQEGGRQEGGQGCARALLDGVGEAAGRRGAARLQGPPRGVAHGAAAASRAFPSRLSLCPTRTCPRNCSLVCR